MNFFQSIRGSFAVIGINPHQLTQKYPFNVRNIVCLQLFGISTITSVAYFLYVANDFGEYTNSAFSISGAIVCGVSMSTMIGMMPKLFEFFTDVENTVNESE